MANQRLYATSEGMISCKGSGDDSVYGIIAKVRSGIKPTIGRYVEVICDNAEAVSIALSLLSSVPISYLVENRALDRITKILKIGDEHR